MHVQRAVTSVQREQTKPQFRCMDLQGDNLDGLPIILTSKAGRAFHFPLFLTPLSLRPDQCSQSSDTFSCEDTKDPSFLQAQDVVVCIENNQL